MDPQFSAQRLGAPNASRATLVQDECLEASQQEAGQLCAPVAVYTTNLYVPLYLFGGFCACGEATWLLVRHLLQSDPYSSGGIVIGSICLLLIGLCSFAIAFQRWGLRVLVYADGLMYIRKGRKDFCGWDQVETVWLREPTLSVVGVGGLLSGLLLWIISEVFRPVIHKFTILRCDGKKLVFDGFIRKVHQLGVTIQAETAQRLLTRATADFKAGKTLTFGTFVLSRKGMSYLWRQLPWAALESVTVDNGRITVRRKGQWSYWLATRVAKSANLHVFLALVERVLAEIRKKRQGGRLAGANGV